MRAIAPPRWIGRICALIVLGIAGALLVHDVRGLTGARIADAILRIPPRALLASFILTAASFLALGFYDVLAVRVVAPMRIVPWLSWLAGFAGNAVANTLGFHALTGSLVRCRLYRAAKLALPDVARIISLSWATLGFGFLIVSAAILLFAPGASSYGRTGGAGLLGALIILLFWLRGGRDMRFAGLSLSLPSARIAAVQMALSAMEMGAAIGALYVLMPPAAMPSFAAFSAAYIGAVLLGIVSHAPGGIGVFEAVMLALADTNSRAELLAALLLYRLIYNLLPFFSALLALAGFEFVTRRHPSWISDSGGSDPLGANKALPA